MLNKLLELTKADPELKTIIRHIVEDAKLLYPKCRVSLEIKNQSQSSVIILNMHTEEKEDNKHRMWQAYLDACYKQAMTKYNIIALPWYQIHDAICIEREKLACQHETELFDVLKL